MTTVGIEPGTFWIPGCTVITRPSGRLCLSKSVWSSRNGVSRLYLLQLVTAISVSARSNHNTHCSVPACTVWHRCNIGIVGSNPSRGTLLCVVLFRVGGGLATGRSPGQGSYQVSKAVFHNLSSLAAHPNLSDTRRHTTEFRLAEKEYESTRGHRCLCTYNPCPVRLQLYENITHVI